MFELSLSEGCQQDACELFLAQVSLLTLTNEHVGMLEAPILMEEIAHAIDTLKSDKSPDPDILQTV